MVVKGCSMCFSYIVVSISLLLFRSCCHSDMFLRHCSEFVSLFNLLCWHCDSLIAGTATAGATSWSHCSPYVDTVHTEKRKWKKQQHPLWGWPGTHASSLCINMCLLVWMCRVENMQCFLMDRQDQKRTLLGAWNKKSCLPWFFF